MFRLLLQPPSINIILILIAAFFWVKKPKVAKWAIGISVGTLYFFSTNIGSYLIASCLINYPELTIEQLKEPPKYSAIVILGGGIRSFAKEYGGVDVASDYTVSRVLYGSWLKRWTKLPILVSGGATGREGISEARLMADLLDNMGTKASWLDENSIITKENAAYCAQILHSEGINTIYLVTHAIHIKRSVEYFKAYGFKIIPSPTHFPNRTDILSIKSWLPNAGAMLLTVFSLREIYALLLV